MNSINKAISKLIKSLKRVVELQYEDKHTINYDERMSEALPIVGP